MKPFLSLISLFALSTLLPAQGLQIYLDASKGKTLYVCDGDTLSRPAVKRGAPITLHLLNYNNYLYEVEIEELQRRITYASAGIDTSQVGGLSKSPGNSGLDLISSIMNPSGLMGLGQLATGQLSFLGGLSFGTKGFAADEEESALMGEMEEIEFRYEKVLDNWARTENNLASIQRDVEHLVNAKAIQSMALDEIRRLQYNPNLSVHQIRKLTGEYLEMVFGERPVGEIDMDFLWALHQTGQNISIYLQQLESERSNYLGALDQIRETSLQLADLKDRIRSPKVMDTYDKMDQSMKTSLEKGKKEILRLDTTHKDLEALSSQFGQDNYEELIQLRYIYEELIANEYSFTYQTSAKEDITELDVRLVPKSDLPSHIKVSPKNLASYEITSRGGLKINGSIGLGFGQFFDPAQNYSVRSDSVITGDPAASFVPYLASYLHFYNYRPGAVAFGGSFGIGIPVFDSQSGQSVAFFLGPSVFLGGAQRITLTGGILGARVETLSNGYSVGDKLDDPFAGVPTKGSYQLGYFLGISINVIGQ